MAEWPAGESWARGTQVTEALLDAWQVALLALVALFVGLTIPVLLQLRSTLKEIRSAARDLKPTLQDARVSARRIEHLTRGVEGREQSVAEVLDSAGDLARALDRLKDTTRVATAVGASVAAAVKSFRDTRAAAAEEAAAEEAAAESEEEPSAPPPSNGAGRSSPETSIEEKES